MLWETVAWIFVWRHILTEEEQLLLVQKDSENIYGIYTSLGGTFFADARGFKGEYLEPSENVKLAAVQNGGRCIKWIINPSEEIQLAAVQNYPLSFLWIHQPVTIKSIISEKVKLFAVDRMPELISIMANPSEELQILAVGKQPNLIKDIKNACDAAKDLAKKLIKK